MKMNRILGVALLSAMLAGCGGTQLSGDTTTLQVPVGNDQLFEFQIPVECTVQHTDNVAYWELTEGVTVKVTGKVEHVGVAYDTLNDVYVSTTDVSKDVNDMTIDVMVKPSMLDEFGDYLGAGSMQQVSTNLDKKLKIKKMPGHNDKSEDMEINATNLYMPKAEGETITEGNFTADVVNTDKGFLMCWIQDGKFEDIRDKMISYLVANTGKNGVESWYKDKDDSYYLECGDHMMVIKQLKFNSFCIYLGSTGYKDYALTAMEKLHAKNN